MKEKQVASELEELKWWDDGDIDGEQFTFGFVV